MTVASMPNSFAERSKARILKPGELTLVVYGADEAIKWECRVLSFLQADDECL